MREKEIHKQEYAKQNNIMNQRESAAYTKYVKIP